MMLHYRVLGEGFPFIILHGLFGSSDNWQTHAKRFSEYFQVILVDLRNHGHSPWSEEMSYEAMAQDVKLLAKELNINKFHLLGHSMGGKTAIRFAQLFPEQIEKMIVVDIGIKTYPSHHDHILAGIHAVKLEEKPTRGDADEMLAKHIPSDAERLFLAKNLYWKEKDQLAWRMNVGVLERVLPTILNALPDDTVPTPTLVMRGGRSNYILDQDLDDLESVLIDMDLVTFEEAGHWVHAEVHEPFSDSVLSFLLR